MADAVLCYVMGPLAYFTTRALTEQWGDDWDDVPYEHNAGEPYPPTCHYFSDGRIEKRASDFYSNGKPRWRIETLMWTGDFDEPRESHLNSPWSVQRINQGATPWLKPKSWNTAPTATPIMAGTTVREFIRLVRLGGGNVYVEAPK